MERIDKRRIPYKELVSAAERRAFVPQADKITLSKPEVELTKNTLGGKDRFPNNERRGGANPFVSQAAGGTPTPKPDRDVAEEQEPNAPKEADDTPPRKRQPMRSTGGGGGSGEQQPGEMLPGEQQPGQQQPGGGQPAGASQQLAGQQSDLAGKARDLARDIAKGMDASGEPMAAKAVDELRAGANLMEQAAASFARGDVRSGITQARQAQQAIRSAEHRLMTGQFDSLEAALGAAQDGAAALAANQRRITQGTDQVSSKIGEMTGQPGAGQPGRGEPGKGEPGKGEPGKGEPGKGEPGKGEPGKGEPGKGEPGKGEPGKGEPGKGEPGKGEPGKGEPGAGVPAPSRQQVDEALKRDPRIGTQMKSLAVEQGNLDSELGAFQGYVGDLSKWAKEAAKERVADTLGGVNTGLQSEGTPQKMVDAAVGLAGRDLRSARAAQSDVEKALDNMVKGLQEAGEILAGSPTAVLRGAARDATQIGQRAAALAGVPGTAQPGGQPGKGQPGQAEPTKGEPGKGEPGQGEPGKGQPGKGEPGKTEPAKGQPGKTPADLAQALAAQEQPGGQASGQPSGAQPSPSSSGGGSGRNEDIDALYMKTRHLAGVLKQEQLVDAETLQFIERKATDVDSFRKRFERARQTEAGQFADVMLGVGKNLEATLQEVLSAKRLYTEQQEECPPKYRSYVNAYFEALSKAATKGR
jgi:hypothetical protein